MSDMSNLSVEEIDGIEELQFEDLDMVSGAWLGRAIKWFKRGYAVGTFLDKKFNLSDKLADAACDLTDCDKPD